MVLHHTNVAAIILCLLCFWPVDLYKAAGVQVLLVERVGQLLQILHTEKHKTIVTSQPPHS